MYDISEQIGTWQKKIAYYENREVHLKQLITDAENLRERVNRLPVGSPKIDTFYKRLNSLYTQLATLPAKIRHCRDNISTLQCEL